MQNKKSNVYLREGVIKKIEKKVGNFQLSVFDPPPMKVGKKTFFRFFVCNRFINIFRVYLDFSP